MNRASMSVVRSAIGAESRIARASGMLVPRGDPRGAAPRVGSARGKKKRYSFVQRAIQRLLR